MSDFETFDAPRVEDLAAEGEWVLVVLLDDSDTSREWEQMLEDKIVEKWLENYSSFLMQLEASPREASEAMERWEVDQLPALVIVDGAGNAFGGSYLSADSVEHAEDIAQYLDDHASALHSDEDEFVEEEEELD